MREKTPDSASGTTSSGAVRPAERQVDTHTPTGLLRSRRRLLRRASGRVSGIRRRAAIGGARLASSHLGLSGVVRPFIAILSFLGTTARPIELSLCTRTPAMWCSDASSSNSVGNFASKTRSTGKVSIRFFSSSKACWCSSVHSPLVNFRFSPDLPFKSPFWKDSVSEPAHRWGGWVSPAAPWARGPCGGAGLPL